MRRRYFLALQNLKKVGFKKKGMYMVCYMMEVSDSTQTFALPVPYKRLIPKASKRNLMKRRIRNLCQMNKKVLFCKQLLIIPNAHSYSIPFQDIQRDFQFILKFMLTIIHKSHFMNTKGLL